jgi:hypothetical protein
MNLPAANPVALGAAIALAALLLAFVLWLVFRPRPAAEELERRRRQSLTQSGRLVDGMLLDVCEVQAADGRTLSMLVYNYRIGGVDYECSQDVSALCEILNMNDVRAGFPCSVRYQPGNPQNSIVIAESWSGLREGLPVLPVVDDPDPLDLHGLR